MIKNTLIIVLLLLVIYLYYQRQNNLATFTGSASPRELQEVKKVNRIFADFCENEIGGSDINEIRTKLNGRTLSEILEENEDYETKTDELTRKKGELEAEVIMLTNSRKNQIQEKERIITRLKEEKSELEKKVKSKAKLLDEEQCENNKLTQQIEQLEAQVKELQKENTKFKEAIRNTIEILRKHSTKTSLLTCSREVVQKLNQAQEKIKELEEREREREPTEEVNRERENNQDQTSLDEPKIPDFRNPPRISEKLKKEFRDLILKQKEKN